MHSNICVLLPCFDFANFPVEEQRCICAYFVAALWKQKKSTKNMWNVKSIKVSNFHVHIVNSNHQKERFSFAIYNWIMTSKSFRAPCVSAPLNCKNFAAKIPLELIGALCVYMKHQTGKILQNTLDQCIKVTFHSFIPILQATWNFVLIASTVHTTRIQLASWNMWELCTAVKHLCVHPVILRI